MKFLAYALVAFMLGGTGVATYGLHGAEQASEKQSVQTPAHMEVAAKQQPESHVMTATTGSKAETSNTVSTAHDVTKANTADNTDTNTAHANVAVPTETKVVATESKHVVMSTTTTTVQQPAAQYSAQGTSGSQVAEQSGSAESDQQKAQDMTNQQMQQILQQQGLNGASGQTFTGPNSDQQAQAWIQQQQQNDQAAFQQATSQSAQVAQGNEGIKQFLLNVVGIPASQLPSNPTGGNKDVTDGVITAINGQPVSCTYSKTLSGSGYSITYMVMGGQALEVRKVGNVPANLIPAGY